MSDDAYLASVFIEVVAPRSNPDILGAALN